MRIVCQKCSAAYAIDDKFVTPKGVRAQCPRCRHLQLVKKDDAAAAAPPAPAAAPPAPAPGDPSPFLFDMAAPPPPAPGGGELHFGQTSPAAGAPTASPFDFSAPTSPGGAAASNPFDFGSAPPGSPASASPFDFGAPPAPAPAAPGGNPFDFGAPPPPAPAAASSSPFDFSSPPLGKPVTNPGTPFDFAAATAGKPAAAANPFDFGAPPPPAAKPAAAGSPFDFGAPPPGEAPPTPRLSAPRPATGPSFPGKPSEAAARAEVIGVRCRTCGKDMTDPFDQALGVCDDCRSKTVDSAGDAASAPTSAQPAAPRAAPAGPPMFPSPTATMAPPPDASRTRTAMRDDGGAGKKKLALAIGGGLLVIAIVGGLLVKRPWVSRPPPLVVQPSGGGGKPVADAIVLQWRAKYPDLEGSSDKQLVDEGEELLLKDTTKAYADAEESFEQALVLDSSNERALAGWVLSVAFGRPGQIDEPTAKAAETMLAAAEQRTGDGYVFAAHAHFLIARSGNPNDIKVLAERGLSAKDPRVQALAKLAVGQTVLTKNPQDAARNFREALAIDPKAKRAYFFQAQLAAIQGNYKEATRALERRLELDADQWEAAEELARLLIDVGDVPRARKVLEAAREASSNAPRPRLDLAILAYQHQGDLKAADEQLNALIADAEVPKLSKADAMVHLATIQRLQGQPDKAIDLLDRALEISRDSVPAKLQKWLTLLDKNVTSSARLELDGIKGKVGDKYLESTMEARQLIAEDRFAEAIQTLSATIEADARRVDAIFLAGAAAAKSRKDGKAWEYCLRRGLRADPMSRPVPPLTHLYVRPADLLKPAVGAYAALVKDDDDDPSPSLCEGLVAWYSEDAASADRLFTKVVNIDTKNSDAYAFRSLLALKKKDVSGALKLAGKSIDSGKVNALAFFAQAQAQAQANKIDQAKIAAKSSLKYGPQLLGPKVILGDAEASSSNGDEARRVLTSVLLVDPLYRDAKRVLYKHQL
jgi:predicted Zn finger-like uncharacterized protein